MNSVLNELSVLRKNAPLVIDHKNSNRYRVVAAEPDGSKTAYYFTAPVYNTRTRKAVDMRFYSNGERVYATGSNASITVTGNMRMENAEGACTLSLAARKSRVSEHGIVYGNEQICPTTNGVAIKSTCKEATPYTFTIEISKPFLEVRANEKCFALMSERFRPFVTVSCIGTTDVTGNIIAPAKLTWQKITDRKYTVTVTPCSSLGKAVLIEANLYEPKLFQDTTVESKNPKTNNAFGSIGFIGTTKEFGEQWLYTRPDVSRMTELNDKKILHAILHLPKWNNGAVELAAFMVSARFCSFGSTWNSKIAEAALLADSQITDHYIDIDLTSLLSDRHGRLLRGEGLILKAKKKGAGFSVIATGDSYLSPQILEVNYR